MKKAWIENGVVRDVCRGDPAQTYHPDIAAQYDTDVPDDAVNGATLEDGVWINPPPPPPAPPPAPPPEPDWRTPMMSELRAKRDTLLNVLDGIQADALTSGNTADAISCKNIKAALKGVPELPSVVNATSATALKMATIMAYQSAIAGAPVGVLALFAGYLK